MSLEDFSPEIESSEGMGSSVESAKEASEKYQKKTKKSSVGIKRTQKDEKKAKKHDFLLAGFLVKILVDKQYDPLLPYIFTATAEGYPSNFVLGIISLIHTDISNNIRDFSQKPHIEFTYKSEQTTTFNNSHIDPKVRERINYWVEDIVDVVSIEYSSLLTKKLRMKLHESHHDMMSLIQAVFRFFLSHINITISDSQLENISEFILGEIIKEMKKLHIEEI